MRKNQKIKGIKIIIQGLAILIITLIFQIKQIFSLSKENITEFVILLIPTIILALVLYACIKKIKQERNPRYIKKYIFYGNPYETVLTTKELEFYNLLKPIADKYDMLIFSKVRLADIIQTRNQIDFKKVCSKHIDFVITDKDTYPIAYIELDDVSHTYEETIIRDEKKNIIFESAGLHLIRVKTTEMERKLPFIETILMNKKKSLN